MLTLTAEAVSAVRQLTKRPDMPEDTGLRIASVATGDGAATYAIDIAEAPLPTDQVVEAEGARVYLDQTAATEFDDKALDAEVEAGQVRFQLMERPE